MELVNHMSPVFVSYVKTENPKATEIPTDSFTKSEQFSNLLAQKQQNDFPYGSRAKDGVVEYNGIVFSGDAKTHTLSLGDVSDPRKVLNISLPSGGNLKVNVDNLGQLAQAAGMFSAEDLNAILRAIEQYKHCTQKLNEIDEMENQDVEESAEETPQQAFERLKNQYSEKNKLTGDNIKNEDDWRKMDEDQWGKLLAHIDKYIDTYREELEELKERQDEVARKSVAEAPADQKAIAASSAALDVAVSGLAGEDTKDDVSFLEKSSWTYGMTTEDQGILATAKKANEFAEDMVSKTQEMLVTEEMVPEDEAFLYFPNKERDEQ